MTFVTGRTWFCVLLVVGFVSGCGIKGDLELPSDGNNSDATESPAPESPASEPSASEFPAPEFSVVKLPLVEQAQ